MHFRDDLGAQAVHAGHGRTGAPMMLPREEINSTLLLARLRLLAYLRVITGSGPLSEELFHAVCGDAFQKTGGFDSPEHLLNWARLAALNRGMEAVRQRDGSYRGLSLEALSALGSEWMESASWTGAEGLEALTRCHGALAPGHRDALRRLYGEQAQPAIQDAIDANGMQSVPRSPAATPSRFAAWGPVLVRVHLSLIRCVQRKLEEA